MPSLFASFAFGFCCFGVKPKGNWQGATAQPRTATKSASKVAEETETKVKNFKSFIWFLFSSEFTTIVVRIFIFLLCALCHIHILLGFHLPFCVWVCTSKELYITTRHKRSHNAISGSKLLAIFHWKSTKHTNQTAQKQSWEQHGTPKPICWSQRIFYLRLISRTFCLFRSIPMRINGTRNLHEKDLSRWNGQRISTEIHLYHNMATKQINNSSGNNNRWITLKSLMFLCLFLCFQLACCYFHFRCHIRSLQMAVSFGLVEAKTLERLLEKNTTESNIQSKRYKWMGGWMDGSIGWSIWAIRNINY